MDRRGLIFGAAGASALLLAGCLGASKSARNLSLGRRLGGHVVMRGLRSRIQVSAE